MKLLFAFILPFLLGGCFATLDTAGSAAYEVSPYQLAGSDKVVCCTLSIKDGKEFEGRGIVFQTDGKGWGIQINEGQSKAFKGQGIAAKAATVLPVTGLQELVK